MFFDDVEISVDILVDEKGVGFRNLVDRMNVEQILIACEGIGEAKYFLERPVNMLVTAWC